MENSNEKLTASFLPNPELKRDPIVGKCMGCQKIYENHALPESEVLVDVCICYADPELHWSKYRIENETIQKAGKPKLVTYHYSPCPMATHIKHTPKVVKVRDRVKRK